ncbi:MAG TPA: hypothetical protein VN824_16380, partial [Puia sp.]|nr:hypothetical protein [Puia sp.]
MSKAIPILLLSLLLSAKGFCQFGSLINKAKNKVNQRIDRKADKAMDQTLDKAEGKNSSEPAAGADNNSQTAQPATMTSYSKYDFV